MGFAKANTEGYSAWIAAGRWAELHALAQGGHGFGMLRQGLPADTWTRTVPSLTAFAKPANVATVTQFARHEQNAFGSA